MRVLNVLKASKASRPCPCPSSSRRRCVSVRANGGQDIGQKLFGDMGARDATRGEIETNFSDKVWFNWDTTHIIKPPEALKQYMGLTSRTCVAAPVRMEDKDVELLRNQVPGFKLATAREGGLTCIRQEWKAKDAGSAASLSAAVSALAKELGHPAAVYVSGADVAVELTTPSVGGLSENDFVVACKINAMNVKDFLAKKKPKYWA